MPSTEARRLFVLRHAHSSWALPGQRDHQRPLDERGRADARRIGAEIGRRGFAIERVLCSTAVRARETLDLVRPFLAAGASERLTDDLYALGADSYLAAVRAESGRGSLLLVGHNPMVEEFTRALAPQGEPGAMTVLHAGFPTAGLAVVDLSAPFEAAAKGGGRLAALVHPRGLPSD